MNCFKNPPRLPPRKHRRHARHSIKNAGIRSRSTSRRSSTSCWCSHHLHGRDADDHARYACREQPVTRHHDKKNDSGEQIVFQLPANMARWAQIHWESARSRGCLSARTSTTVKRWVSWCRRKCAQRLGGRKSTSKGDRRASYGAVRHAIKLVNAVGVLGSPLAPKSTRPTSHSILSGWQ